jgi:hypothetical protein
MSQQSTLIDSGSDPAAGDEPCPFPSFCLTLPELIQDAKEEIARDRVRLARLEQRRSASMFTAIGSGVVGIGSLLLLGPDGTTPAAWWSALGVFAGIMLLITHRAITSVKANLAYVTYWRDICIDDAYAASKNQPQF